MAVFRLPMNCTLLMTAVLAACGVEEPTSQDAQGTVAESLTSGDELCRDGGCDGEGGGGGGGGGGTQPTYELQAVIQNEGYEDGPMDGRRLKLRVYSRFANASNNRVDADYINVRCNAYDQYGHYTTDYDSENNGALVDVHFKSNFVYGLFRTITVHCQHHATHDGITYDSTSTAQIYIPE